MDWKDVAPTLGKVAPVLGGLLAGPAGTAVGGLVASALGVNSPEEAHQALQAQPEAALKLRQIEADHTEHLAQLTLQSEVARLDAEHRALEVDAGDRKDARQMQAASPSRIPGSLAIGITSGFFGILGVMLTGVWKPSDNQALLILLGALGTSWGAVVNYYFGSSAGSARKDELLLAAQPAKG